MREVVSVSLGSSSRDHKTEVELLGEKFSISRVGTDGDFAGAVKMLKDLDGHVAAFGLGGIDIYLQADGRRYVIRDSRKLVRAAGKTPVVDGSGLKNTLERMAVRYMVDEMGLELAGKTVLMVSAVDRFGMAQALNEAGCRIVYGDLIFGLGIPIPIHSFAVFRRTAKTLLPVVTKMPFQILYPTGDKQHKESKKNYAKYYHQADIIAGDFLFVRKHMPRDMTGKWILTNTVTVADVEDMRSRGVELLVTTTPALEGRSFGTNVMEATLIALMGKRPEDVTDKEYVDLIEKVGFKPRVEWLQKPFRDEDEAAATAAMQSARSEGEAHGA